MANTKHGVMSAQDLSECITTGFGMAILFLRAAEADEIVGSEESSRRINSSHVHQTLHKHVNTCYNMISCVAVCS
jgi:hypothetical protein